MSRLQIPREPASLPYPIKTKLKDRRSELRYCLRQVDKDIERLLDFASGKKILKHGKNAKKKMDYQPQDYLRLGNSLANLKRRALNYKTELFMLTGSKKYLS